MTSAVAAVADPSVACALALPAEDVASSVAAPARAREVGWAQRAANVLFGAPSARRACGGAETSFTPKVLRNEKWRRRRETGSVFAVDRKGGAGEGGLPRIWVSEPAPDGKGRTFVASYPCGADRGGWRALELAEVYFSEALGLPGEEHRRRRVDCYRAAEMLLLHAAARGNIGAHCRLGVIYEGDLCEGAYWDGLADRQALHKADTPCDERAYLHFSFGAYYGHGECCWRLGDLVPRVGDALPRRLGLSRCTGEPSIWRAGASTRIVRARATPRCASPAPSSWDAAASRTSAGRAPGTGWPPLASAPPSTPVNGTSSASASRLVAGWPAWPRRSRALTKGNAAADGESRPLRRLSKIAAGLD